MVVFKENFVTKTFQKSLNLVALVETENDMDCAEVWDRLLPMERMVDHRLGSTIYLRECM